MRTSSVDQDENNNAVFITFGHYNPFPSELFPREMHKELQSSRNKTIKSFVLSSAVNKVSCRELFDR